MGTNDVVHATETLVKQFKNNEEVKNKIIRFVMRLKLEDAEVDCIM